MPGGSGKRLLALRHATWPQEYADFPEAATAGAPNRLPQREEQIRREAVDPADIKRRELMLRLTPQRPHMPGKLR